MDRPEIPLNVSSVTGILVPVMTLIEVVINLLAILPAALLLQASEGSLFWLMISLLSIIYAYSAVFLILLGIAMRCTPKPKLGRLDTKADRLRYGILAGFINMLHRNPFAGVLYKASPIPGNLFFKFAGAGINADCLISEDAVICDPFLIDIGAGSVVGSHTVITGHLVPEASVTYLGRVSIGKNVLIGVNSVIYPDVEIGDGAQIQACSRVNPRTKIPAGEIWGGIPAVKIKDATDATTSTNSHA